MIDQIFDRLTSDILAGLVVQGKRNALTAIYEIGLECMGSAELPIEPTTTYREGYVDGKNALRLEQRKAWAKACGVDNG